MCFEAEIWFDPNVINRITVQTPAGETVREWNDQGDASQETNASDTASTKQTETTTSSAVETSAGTETVSEPSSAYFEVAVMSNGETITREFVVFGDDGELARGKYSWAC